MKISARNQLKGTITEVAKGATTSHVRIDIGGGVIVTASITNEAVDELKLAKGKPAIAVIKASDVMVGIGLIDRRTLLAGLSAAALAPRAAWAAERDRRRGPQRGDPGKGGAGVPGRTAGGDPALYAGAGIADRLAARQPGRKNASTCCRRSAHGRKSAASPAAATPPTSKPCWR